MRRFSCTILLLLLVGLVSCSGPQQADKPSEHPRLSIDLAKRILALPVSCLEIEYPNKLGQVLGGAEDLQSPRQLHPVFYGCFDWHSAVHGYWTIVQLLKQFPELDLDGEIRSLLSAHLTPENIQVEIAFFKDQHNQNFERTYGWAWLFKLQEALITWDDAQAKEWAAALQPLVEVLIDKYHVYLPKLVYPIRAGQHDNSAFSLSLSLDYARSSGNVAFESLIREHATRLYQGDRGCDLGFEPSGYDFLSPCLEEAYLMSRLMDRSAYLSWLPEFMPELLTTDFQLSPAIVKDRSDGKLVHLDGLNYSRSACLYGLSQFDDALAHLAESGQSHFDFSIDNLSHQDDYMGSHWLGTFALYALERSAKIGAAIN